MSYFDDEKNHPNDEEENESVDDQDEGSDDEDESEDDEAASDEGDGDEESEGGSDEAEDDDDLDGVDLDEDGEDDDDSQGSDDKDTSATAIQKKKWRKRALAAERKLQDLQKGKQGNKAPAKKKSSNSSLQERNDFRMDYPELKTKEVDEIEAFAKTKGVSLREALKNPIIQIMIRRNAQKRKAAGSSFDPSRRSQPTKPEKDWSRASRSEMEAEASRRVAAAEAKRNGR